MIFNMVGVGGSGGLNFEVVGGTTQPTSPKENTIWVNTSTDITGWAFSVTEPSSPVEGMVWIKTNTSGIIAFNALNKNTIEIYPLSAKQYISGAWVDKTAKIYQNQQWVDWWNGELYKNGETYNDITGGWGSKSSTAGNVIEPVFESDGIRISFSRAKYATQTSSIASTADPIDLADVTTLSINIYSWSGSRGYFRFGVCHSSTTNASNLTSYITINEAGIHELDVQSLDGLYYVVFGANSFWGADETMSIEAKATEIKMI